MHALTDPLLVTSHSAALRDLGTVSPTLDIDTLFSRSQTPETPTKPLARQGLGTSHSSAGQSTSPERTPCTVNAVSRHRPGHSPTDQSHPNAVHAQPSSSDINQRQPHAKPDTPTPAQSPALSGTEQTRGQSCPPPRSACQEMQIHPDQRDKHAHARHLSSPSAHNPAALDLVLMANSRLKLSRTSWLLDSGSSIHVANDRSIFQTYTALQGHHVYGIGKLSAPGEGSVRLQFTIDGRVNTVTLLNVVYLPSSPHNIISLGKMHRAGYSLAFPLGSEDIIISRDGQRLAHCRNIGDVYALGNVRPLHAGESASTDSGEWSEYTFRPRTPDPPENQGESAPKHTAANSGSTPSQAPARPTTPANPPTPLIPLPSPAPSTLTQISSRESTPATPQPRSEIIGDISARNIIYIWVSHEATHQFRFYRHLRSRRQLPRYCSGSFCPANPAFSSSRSNSSSLRTATRSPEAYLHQAALHFASLAKLPGHVHASRFEGECQCCRLK
uniref:Retrovirus-related Pol polyprotein from transposon TNT 1-94-like beta-barrel domain-containing protein n=1 Tax=Mycena chlorophos TaxID=658473 RepID=A0ABQ0LWR9_MYCCL|nr:predicted protein [Mycena chlorophos]